MATKQLKQNKGSKAAPAAEVEASEDITVRREVVVAPAGVVATVLAKLKGFIEQIFDGEARIAGGQRGFAAQLNEVLPANWYTTPKIAEGVSPEAKVIKPYRTMLMDAYLAHGKNRNAGRQAWNNVLLYAHEAADPVWAEAEKAKAVAAKTEADKKGAHANTPKEPIPRILADVFPVYKMLYKAEKLSASEREAMKHIRAALKCIGAPLAEFEDGK